MADGIGHQTVKVQNRADPNFFLATQTGTDVCVLDDEETENQYWILDSRWGGEARDASGQPGYLLVNKATNMALKPSGPAQMCQMSPWDPHFRDDSLLWTFGPKDEGEGFRALRPLSEVALNLDVKGGKCQDGCPVVVFEWKDDETDGHNFNQMWKVLTQKEMGTFRENYAEYLKQKKEEVAHSRNSKLAGVAGALAGAYAAYEWRQMEKDPEDSSHKVKAGIAAAVAAAAGGFAVQQHMAANSDRADQDKVDPDGVPDHEKKGWF